MSSRKTKEELEAQIENEKARLEKLRKQLKAKERAEAEKIRKERNHRLILIGGTIEKYCGEITDLEALDRYIQQYTNAIKRTQIKSTEAVSSGTEVIADGDSIEDEYF